MIENNENDVVETNSKQKSDILNDESNSTYLFTSNYCLKATKFTIIKFLPLTILIQFDKC